MAVKTNRGSETEIIRSISVGFLLIINKIELDKFKREVLQIDQSNQNNLHGSDQKRKIKELLNGVIRAFSKLLANFFTEYELPPHREKELRVRGRIQPGELQISN